MSWKTIGQCGNPSVELLEDAGYAVRAYSKAEELLARDAALEPGCIVSEVRMPGTSDQRLDTA
jgi:FixJ family two-component response regulator